MATSTKERKWSWEFDGKSTVVYLKDGVPVTQEDFSRYPKDYLAYAVAHGIASNRLAIFRKLATSLDISAEMADRISMAMEGEWAAEAERAGALARAVLEYKTLKGETRTLSDIAAGLKTLHSKGFDPANKTEEEIKTDNRKARASLASHPDISAIMRRGKDVVSPDTL